MSSIEEFKPTLDKLIESAEASAIASVRLTAQIEAINSRVRRLESVTEKVISDLAAAEGSVHKTELCPYKRKFEEYDRLVFGGPDTPGFVGQLSRAQDQLSWYKGAFYIVGTLTALLFPTVITLLVLVIKNL